MSKWKKNKFEKWKLNILYSFFNLELLGEIILNLDTILKLQKAENALDSLDCSSLFDIDAWWKLIVEDFFLDNSFSLLIHEISKSIILLMKLKNKYKK